MELCNLRENFDILHGVVLHNRTLLCMLVDVVDAMEGKPVRPVEYKQGNRPDTVTDLASECGNLVQEANYNAALIIVLIRRLESMRVSVAEIA